MFSSSRRLHQDVTVDLCARGAICGTTACDAAAPSCLFVQTQCVPQLVSLQQNQEKTGPVVLLQHKHFTTSLLSADGHLIGIHRSEAKS